MSRSCLLTNFRPAAISWLFFRLGLSLPHIIAGENLNMPVLGPVLSKCGAVFIRRSFGDDPMYSTVVKEYIEQLLENGKNSEYRSGVSAGPKETYAEQRGSEHF